MYIQNLAKIVPDQKQISQMTNIIESFITGIKDISSEEITIGVSISLKSWWLGKPKEEKFKIMEKFIKESYMELY